MLAAVMNAVLLRIFPPAATVTPAESDELAIVLDLLMLEHAAFTEASLVAHVQNNLYQQRSVLLAAGHDAAHVGSRFTSVHLVLAGMAGIVKARGYGSVPYTLRVNGDGPDRGKTAVYVFCVPSFSC